MISKINLYHTTANASLQTNIRTTKNRGIMNRLQFRSLLGNCVRSILVFPLNQGYLVLHIHFICMNVIPL